MRLSDDERQDALDVLEEHVRSGRLDIDEYGTRSAKVTAAKRVSELVPLFDDLPSPRPSALLNGASAPPVPVMSGDSALQQFLIPVSGAFEVALDDGRERARVALDCPWKGLLVPPMIWAAEENFAAGTVCLVLTSDLYREDDYIRDHVEFLHLVRA